MRRPRRLIPGSKVLVAAPAGPVMPDDLEQGLNFLESLGLHVVFQADVAAKNGYLAGSDQRRADELARYLEDRSGNCLWFARGGYGTMRTFEVGEAGDSLFPNELDKLVVGFSDLTPLINYLSRRFELVTIHGPTLASLGGLSEQAKEHLVKLLVRGDRGIVIPALRSVPGRRGKARARLAGGNLSLLCSTIGTPLETCFSGRIVLIEEVGEAPYRIDRSLTQLRLAGVLNRAAGVVVGHPSSNPNEQDQLFRIFEERLGDMGIPVLLGLPVGHRADNFALPIGGLATLDADHARLILEEPAVE